MDFLPQILRRPRFWLIVAGLLLVYAAAGFLLLPSVIKSQLRAAVADNYRRELQIGAVRFNPFTFALEISDLALPDVDGRAMLALDRVRVDFDLSSILRRAWTFGEITLDRPRARFVVRRDGSANFADLKGPSPPTPPPADTQPLPRVFIGKFRVNDGGLDFEDQSRPTPFSTALRPINFGLTNFSTGIGGDNAYELLAESARGERLAWRGTLQAAPFGSQGEFSLSNVQAHTLWDYVRDALNFEVPAGSIDLNGRYSLSFAGAPLQLQVTGESVIVRGLKLKPPDPAPDYVVLDELAVRNARFDLAQRRVDVEQIRLNGATVQAWMDSEGKFNLTQLGLRSAAPQSGEAASAAPATAAAPDSSAPWQVSLPRIELGKLQLHFEDRQLQPAARITLAPVDLTLLGYSTAPAAVVKVDAGIGIDATGKLSVQGELHPDPVGATLDLKLSGFDLRPLQAYLGQYTDLTLTSGQLGLNGRLALERDAQQILQPKFTGTVELAKLRTIDNALEQDLVRWDKLTATGIDYDGARHRLAIRQISALKPYARVIIASNRTLNIASVLKPARTAGSTSAQAPQASAPAPAAAPFSVRIDTVRFDKASANFADYSLEPNFATGIMELSGTVAGLSSDPRSRAKVSLDGKVDAYAPVTIAGEVNYLSADSYTDLKLAFQNMELTTFTPYSGKFAGYRIEKGKLGVDLSYHIENRQLKADHKFVLSQLTLGERVDSKDAISLPVKLAIALLKDRNGVIDVDLPVSGSLDDPQFRLGPIIWKAVLGLLTKIVTAPFALLGSLFGGGEDINQLSFAAGAMLPDEDSLKRIDAVGKALHERPGLELEIPMTVNAAFDGPALQRAQLPERLLAIKRRELLARRQPVDTLDAGALVEPQERLRLLTELARQDGLLTEQPASGKQGKPPTPAPEQIESEIGRLEALIVPTIPVGEIELAELGKARAEAVRERLLAAGELDAARVFITSGGAAAASADAVRMDLALK